MNPLKEQFKDFEDEIIYITSYIENSLTFEQRKFEPLFFSSCYRMLAIFCADLLDPRMKDYITNIQGSDYEDKVTNKMKSLGYEDSYISSFCDFYFSLREFRNFITHRGLNKDEPEKISRITKVGIKVNTKLKIELEDINLIRKIYYASTSIFLNKTTAEFFSINPLTPTYYEDIRLKKKIYHENDYVRLLMHNLLSIFEDYTEHEFTNSFDDLNFSLENILTLLNKLENIDLKNLTKKISDSITSESIVTMKDTEVQIILNNFLSTIDETELKTLLKLKNKNIIIIKNISWVKRTKLLSANTKGTNCDNFINLVDKLFVLDRFLYQLY
jgi:hypothetical protein